MIEITKAGTTLIFDENKLTFEMRRDQEAWRWAGNYVPKMICEEGEFLFQDASRISHEKAENGTGSGILSVYEGFCVNGTETPYTFETFVWIAEATGDVFFEWIPVKEEGLQVQKVLWPGEMEFEEAKEDWYTLLNQEQGMLIPNTWPEELKPVIFDGFFGTAGGYMPWFGQVRGRSGYIAICVTPWNAGYQAEHPANGPYSHVSVRFEPCLLYTSDAADD